MMPPEASWSISLTTSVYLVVASILCGMWLLPRLRSLSTPGPWGVPLLGYYPFLRRDFYTQLHEQTKRHGPVYLINLVGQSFLYLDNVTAVREAHVAKGNFFPARSLKHNIMQYCFGDGLMYLKGEEWRVQRKFLAQSMREVGLGPRNEGPIGDAVRSTLEHLRTRNPSDAIDFTALLSKECTNAVLRLILGDAVSKDEAEKINDAYLKMLMPMGDKNTLLLGSIARHFILPFIRGYSEMMRGKKEMHDLLEKIVADHKRNFDDIQQPKDLIDAYLRERALRERRRDPHAKYFTDKYLVSMLMLAYGDGSVGVAVFVSSFLRELSYNRDAQDAIFQEIYRVVGTERLPTWEDRNRLPLTVSALKELFRITTFFPVYPSLECISDTTVLGVGAPKGCVTLVNNWALHHDPIIYKNPNRFDISRFLPGKYKEDDPVSFGVGRRACAGETLVMTETFAFLTSLLQHYYIAPATDEKNTRSKDLSPYEDTMHCHLRAVPRLA